MKPLNDDLNSPTQIRTVPTEFEAAAIVAALASHGIRSSTTGDFTSGFRAEAPGWVKVVVAQKDFEESNQILTELESNSEAIDWSKIDVGTPDKDA